jgi:hypothetical protein
MERHERPDPAEPDPEIPDDEEAARRNADERASGRPHANRLTRENASLRRRLHETDALKAENAAKDERIAALESEIEGLKGRLADADPPELTKRALIAEALGEIRPLDHGLARRLVGQVAEVRDGKLYVGGEELTPEDLREILPPELLPTKAGAGSGGRQPRPATDIRGRAATDEELVRRGVESSAFFEKNKAEIHAAERRLAR